MYEKMFNIPRHKVSIHHNNMEILPQPSQNGNHQEETTTTNSGKDMEMLYTVGRVVSEGSHFENQ
jgi:hypothetical protein